jgi:hypothetical protein
VPHRTVETGAVALARLVGDRLERDVDRPEAREIGPPGEAARALVVALLVGHLSADGDGFVLVVVQPDAVRLTLPRGRQLRLHDQGPLAAAVGDDGDPLVLVGGVADRLQEQLAEDPRLRLVGAARVAAATVVVVPAGEQEDPDDDPGDREQPEQPADDPAAADGLLGRG